MARQLENFLKPNSVAVIGASNNTKKVGYAVLKNIIDFGFEGEILPVNLKEKEILGLKVYPSILDIEQKVDLAIFVVPAEVCIQTAKDCVEKGIKNIIIISAGFKEIGLEGARLERELFVLCKDNGINVLGPNCVGYIDTQNKLNASFTTLFPNPGNIALISQSGSVITSIVDWSIPEHIGFSKIISLGNKMDLNETDFLESLANDPNTKVVLMYIEGIDDGNNFLRVAKEVIRTKPIVAIKAGISDAGARAASSHTGALAGSKTAYFTAFKKGGIVRADSLEDLFNYGMALSSQPAMANNSIAIITNAGGAGILATDYASEMGLRLSSLLPEKAQILRENLPVAASVHNPIDVLGDAGADRYKFVLDTCMSDDSISGLIVLMSPQAMTEYKETTDVIIGYSQNLMKPLIVCYLGGVSNKESMERLRENNIPCFSFPHAAVRAMTGIYNYSNVKQKKDETYEHFEVDRESVRKIFTEVLNDKRLVLLEYETMHVAKCYGLSSPETQLAKTPEEAIEFADAMGYPVALKISSPDILHKSDLGGIILNITTPEEVRGSFNTILRRISKRMPDAKIYGITVQKQMQKKGKEIIVGANRDPQFGHLIMCGLGGIYVNFLEDVAFRLNPVSRLEAQEMLAETKAFKLLKGVRGEPPSDIQALIDTILRISQLLTDYPLISELDINPLWVFKENEGVSILDMKITIKKEEL